MREPAALSVLFAVVLFGCSASKDESPGTLAGDAAADGAATETGVVDDTGSTEGGLGVEDALPETSVVDPGPAAVYAHSADTLYKLDPDTKKVTVVGDFNGCSNVVDIALDAKSNLYASAGGIFKVDTTTAKCTSVGGGTFAGNSLSFVPAGTIDPVNEVLVSYSGGDYLRVDLAKGTTTKLGALPSGYSSSGDIVSVKGGGTYVTVKGPSCDDCLLEVDPKTGAMKKNWGKVGATDVFGVAFWAGSVYAFTNSGQIFELTFGASSLTAKEIPIPSKPSGLSFWGAGSTTSAPVAVK